MQYLHKRKSFFGGRRKIFMAQKIKLFRKKIMEITEKSQQGHLLCTVVSFICEAANHLNRNRRIFVLRGTKIRKKKQSRIDNISALEQEFLKRFCICGGQNFLERSFKKKFNFCLRTNCPSVFSRQVKLFAGKRLRIRENISVG